MVSIFMNANQEVLEITFLKTLFSDIDSLHLYAGIHAVHFGYHRLLSKRFPFAIYYQLKNQPVQIYAILDCRRDPAWIRNKLT